MATRDERTIQLDVISATDLKHVNEHGKEDMFVVAYIYPEDEKHTKVDKHGGVNPVWNSKLLLTMDEHRFQRGHTVVTIEVRCHKLIGSKLVGATTIPLSSLLEKKSASQHLALELGLESGETQGYVNVDLALGEKRAVPVYEPPSWEMGSGSTVSLYCHPNGWEGYNLMHTQDVM